MAGAVERVLRRALERVTGSSPVLVPEYPLRIRARWGWGSPLLTPMADHLTAHEDDYEEMVREVCELAEWAATVVRAGAPPGEPQWENDYWGGLDALAQVAALRRRNPALYLEIGSGWSTLFARRAIGDFGLRTRVVSIDPAPRADVDVRCDEVVRQPLEDVDLTIFDRLVPGDVVLMDGSHTALMSSDATIFFLEVLPRLPAGVLVGVDDVFLPADYPPTWTARIYGEQYLLAAFLLGGGHGWTVRFPGFWLTSGSRHAARFAPLWPTVENRFGRVAGSLWLERSSAS
jgi:hypothetical protein